MAKPKALMPDSIRLAGRNFRLEITGRDQIGPDTLGWYRAGDGKILLREGMNADQAKSVVLHEIFHDLDYQSGNDLTETQVNSLSALAFSALRDNPDLVAWLMS